MAGKEIWTSITNANHYALDGVPMRISESFRPATHKTESLPPMRFNQGQSNVINFQYDFKTEYGFLDYYKAIQEDKIRVEAELQSNRAQKEAERLAAAAKVPEEKAQGFTPVSVPNRDPKIPGIPAAPTVSSSILLPQRATPPPATVTSISDPLPASLATVNLRDFESLAEDPFNQMELKTIDDMKELQSVLANSPIPLITAGEQSTPALDNLSVSASGQTANGVQENIYENPLSILAQENEDIYENIPRKVPSEEEHVSVTLQKKGPVASPRELLSNNPKECPTNNLNGNASGSLTTAQFNCHTEEVTVHSASKQKNKNKTAVNIPVVKSSSKPPPPVKPKPIVAENVIKTNDLSAPSVTESGTKNSKIKSLAKVIANDLGNAAARPPGAPKGFSYVPPSESESSSKDVKDIEWPDIDQKSLPSTPNPAEGGLASESTEQAPTFSASLNKKKQNSKQKHSTKPDYFYSHSAHMARQAKVTAGADGKKGDQQKPPPPRPTSQPNLARKPATVAGDKEAVDSLVSMGFKKDQITDAIKHIGTDTKQLVEHLCAVQQLVSRGIEWRSAQDALVTCGPDLDKAETFAKAYRQLLEFGFGDIKIKEVLIDCNMDMDKALENLCPDN